MALEDQYGAHNYHPLPVVLTRGEGAWLWDVDGKRYLDFLAAYSAVNQGHCHPRLVAVMQEQAARLTLTSRAFHNDLLGAYEAFICNYFGYDRVLPMNTGVEAGETAIKLARKWAYEVKGVAPNKARVVFAEGNFWGRTLAAVSSSTDPDSYTNFGPYVPGFDVVPYNDLEMLEAALSDGDVAAFMVEPIQGEAGVIIPDEGYLAGVRALCSKYGALFIADEIQTGLGRTGTLLACDHEGVKPDILLLGKALSGGMMPVSAVLSSHEVMNTLKPGQHGSTFGGNPLACALAVEALQIIKDEQLSENARAMGEWLRSGLQSLNIPGLSGIRGRGLMSAVDVDSGLLGMNARSWCERLMQEGLLCKQTHEHTVRMSPPLVLNREQVDLALEAIKASLN
ncbi:MAG: ornithine--oxo-acid transaminase [Bacteroidetes bacterium]|nr:ornithine--oxo-acid transaminase [Bacteroidota bacterium]